MKSLLAKSDNEDERMPKQPAEHHRKAAEHHEHAARHHREAAKRSEAEVNQLAAHHAT